MTSNECIQRVRLGDSVKITYTFGLKKYNRVGTVVAMQLRENDNPLVTVKLKYPESVGKLTHLAIDCHWLELACCSPTPVSRTVPVHLL